MNKNINVIIVFCCVTEHINQLQLLIDLFRTYLFIYHLVDSERVNISV